MKRILALLGVIGLFVLFSFIPDPDRAIVYIVFAILIATFLVLWLITWAKDVRLVFYIPIYFVIYRWRRLVEWVRRYEQRMRITPEEEEELRDSLFI